MERVQKSTFTKADRYPGLIPLVINMSPRLIVDIGPGRGDISLLLARQGLPVISLEIDNLARSSTALRLDAEEDLVYAVANPNSITSLKADCILCLSVLCHHSEGKTRALTEGQVSAGVDLLEFVRESLTENGKLIAWNYDPILSPEKSGFQPVSNAPREWKHLYQGRGLVWRKK